MSKISIKDYQSYIAPLIKECKKKKCSEYWEITRNLPQKQMSQEEIAVVDLFNAIVSYYLVPDSPNEPLKEYIMMQGGKSPTPKDLTTEERDFLQQVLPKIKDNELKARVADTLWVLKHGKAQEHAKNAIEAYLISADTLLEESWHDVWERLARAIRIFDNLRLLDENKCPKKINVPQKISEYIESSTTPPHLVMRLIELLHATYRPYNDEHVKILENIATTYESEPDYHMAKNVWDLAASLYKRAENTDEAIRCQVKAAETYVSLANDKEKAQPPSYLHVSGFLESAVKAYRAIPSENKRSVELYKRLLDAQSKTPDEMHVIPFEIKFSDDEIKLYTDQVSGRNIGTALCNFAFIEEPPRLEEMKKQLENLEQGFSFRSLAPSQSIDRKGRIVGSSSIHNSPESKMHRDIAPLHRSHVVIGALAPALQQIRLEHNISLSDWKSMIKDHPFIPPKRVDAYALGLFHGFHGDFISAAHILIPQIENSIRYLLDNQGEPTSKQLRDGTQEDNNLNKTLESEELKKLFSKDLIFDLQGLLIKKEGENLRNNLLHGRMDDDELFQPKMVYLYWLTLHIIFYLVRNPPTPKPQD